MQTVNVSTLKNNPTQAIRWAQTEPVLVMNRDKPTAWMTSFDDPSMAQPLVKAALAAALFKDGGLGLGSASRLADMPMAQFIIYLGSRRIPVVNLTEQEMQAELDSLEEWIAK